MRLVKQTRGFSCGAACLAMVAGISEEEAMFACKTKRNGTDFDNVFGALKARNFNPYLQLGLHLHYDTSWRFISLASNKRMLIVTGCYINAPKRGRHARRYHAVVVSNGIVYDPSANEPIPIEVYSQTFNKDLIIHALILIDFDK